MGQPDGPWTRWYPNGEKLSEGSYADGVRVGPWMNWYPSATLQIEGDYTGIGGDGHFTTYYESGAPESLGAIQDGVRTGPWKEWWPNGNLEKEVTFLDGQLNGTCTFWSESKNKDTSRSGIYAGVKRVRTE